LNTGHREWPVASESAYAAVGAGSNIILIDPLFDLILIARWIDQNVVNGFWFGTIQRHCCAHRECKISAARA
jgi:hypothetical protein